MLTITIPGGEIFDETSQEFVQLPPQKVRLEHSLVSVSKWESKWKKPFINTERTVEETIDYVRCMNLTQNIDPLCFNFLSDYNLRVVNAYIEDPMTATTISDHNPKPYKKKEIITAEIIYCWMVQLNIPVEFQKWHLNRLLTLIKVVNIKSDTGKKMSKKDTLNYNRALNEARKAKLNTNG